MEAENECAALMEKLEKAISAFFPIDHDPEDPNSAWNDIRLTAESLASHYYTIAICEGKINCTDRTKIIALLDRAIAAIPQDVERRAKENMQEGRKDILLLPTTIMEIESDA
ncbi:hypothetical protein HY213_02830 [Candidatus Peregrinibacteria bacterium]|nr:hypothetical protein [Candidatus Peregrinibacteria bacterium]